MGRLAAYDSESLAVILRRQGGVIRRDQAVTCGLTERALRYRIRPGGPWQAVLPAVYFCATGTMTSRQRIMAAFLYAGGHASKDVAVTGAAALAWHGIRADRGDHVDVVDVLVGLDRRRRDTGFARLHRTGVALGVTYRDGALVYAPPARAIADAARQLADLAGVRAVVAAGVQLRKVQVWQLAEELDAGPVRGSARLRQALAEVASGVRSAAEGDLVDLIRRERLPMPLLNPRLFLGTEFLACPDAWWPDAGVAAEVDSREWHLSPAAWEQTMARHARMSACGIIVLHFPPSRIRADRRAVAAEIRSALAAAQGRRRPQIRALPPC
jgi:very-short-patch-repair endonuclease